MNLREFGAQVGKNEGLYIDNLGRARTWNRDANDKRTFDLEKKLTDLGFSLSNGQCSLHDIVLGPTYVNAEKKIVNPSVIMALNLLSESMRYPSHIYSELLEFTSSRCSLSDQYILPESFVNDTVPLWHSLMSFIALESLLRAAQSDGVHVSSFRAIDETVHRKPFPTYDLYDYLMSSHEYYPDNSHAFPFVIPYVPRSLMSVTFPNQETPRHFTHEILSVRDVWTQTQLNRDNTTPLTIITSGVVSNLRREIGPITKTTTLSLVPSSTKNGQLLLHSSLGDTTDLREEIARFMTGSVNRATSADYVNTRYPLQGGRASSD